VRLPSLRHDDFARPACGTSRAPVGRFRIPKAKHPLAQELLSVRCDIDTRAGPGVR
jgi:hypothetical protein